MPATAKATIRNTQLQIYASNAMAVVTYLTDLEGTGANDANVLIQASYLVPQIGSYGDFAGVPGAPNPTVGSQYPRAIHQMRVSKLTPYIGETNNAKKVFVDVTFESRPQPYIEFGSSGTQTRTETYLQPDTLFNTNFGQRKQMTVDWLAKKGSYLNDQTGVWPPQDTLMLKTPLSGTMFQFGSTIRVGATFYGDELNLSQCRAIAAKYTTTVNRRPLFFTDPSLRGVDDSTCWLCTAINHVTADGGWTIKLSGEFVYNPYGWDTKGVYVNPFTQQPAIITDQDVLNKLYGRATIGIQTTDVYNPTGAGVARYPQQVLINQQTLVQLLSQGDLIGPVPQFDQVMNPSV